MLHTTRVYTRAYCAPEMRSFVRDRFQTDSYSYGLAVDIWSIGVITYRILTGELPFDRRGLVDFYDGKMEFPIKRLEEIAVSSEAVTFVTRLSRPRPMERPSATEASELSWLKTASTGLSPRLPAQDESKLALAMTDPEEIPAVQGDASVAVSGNIDPASESEKTLVQTSETAKQDKHVQTAKSITADSMKTSSLGSDNSCSRETDWVPSLVLPPSLSSSRDAGEFLSGPSISKSVSSPKKFPQQTSPSSSPPPIPQPSKYVSILLDLLLGWFSVLYS